MVVAEDVEGEGASGSVEEERDEDDKKNERPSSTFSTSTLDLTAPSSCPATTGHITTGASWLDDPVGPSTVDEEEEIKEGERR